MSEELKPCPGCGHSDRIRVVNTRDKTVRIGCICGWYVEAYTDEAAIDAWNTRHKSDELPEWLTEAIIKQSTSLMEIPDLDGQIHGNMQALAWVLSLRRGEE